MTDLSNRIKSLIISALELEDITVNDIGDDTPLFDDGLGLDSIDALELGIALQKTFGIKIDNEDKTVRSYFKSVRSLAELISLKTA